MDSNSLDTAKEALFIDENEKAEEFIQTGDLPAAARILIEIVEKDPENWRAFNNMGIISWERNAWEDAFTSFKRACILKPDYSDALINFFDAALKLKRINEALPVFRKAGETNSENEEIAIIVDAIETQGDDIYTSERALAIGTFNPRIKEAQQLLEEGQLNSAMEKFLAINDEEGPHAEIFNGLGIISYYQKRYKDAFTLFYESLKLNPVAPDTYLNIMDAAKECGLIEEAKKIYSHASEKFASLKKIEVQFNQIAEK